MPVFGKCALLTMNLLLGVAPAYLFFAWVAQGCQTGPCR